MNVFLPSPFASIDTSDWAERSPEDLLLDPSWVTSHPTRVAGARALRYARAGKSASYDEIGFRTFASTPQRGPVGIQTIPSMRLERLQQERTRSNFLIEEIQSQIAKIRHRPLTQSWNGQFRYEIVGNVIDLIRTPKPDGGISEETWSFSLSDPPDWILKDSIYRDKPLIISQKYRVDLPGIFWLPLASLIRKGRFERMQECREELIKETSPSRFYCFLSHRWLTPVHPDPEGTQARFAAWQIVGHLCKAIRVADCRGLNEPRRFSPLLGCKIGISGSDMAESLLVNVLRPTLDEHSLAEVMVEVETLDELIDDYAVAVARDDIDLRRLNEILASRPKVRALLDRIYVWYDYSCLPQPPRSEADESLFRQGLERLNLAQILGRTAILLDDTEDYLSRAWCTLESVVADTLGGAPDLLVGSSRPSVREGTVEHFFWTLLQDRPHILWRAILDTEVFAVQTPDECMARLGLSATDPADIRFIYQGLKHLSAPQKIHIDESELVTGVFPLPVVQNGTAVLMPRRSGRTLVGAPTTQSGGTLNWTAVMGIETGWSVTECDYTIPPFLTLKGNPNENLFSSHVAIVGGCEGEAVLFCNWVLRHQNELERVLGVKMVSLSWLSTDIAPIGHIVHGTLQAVPVNAPIWVIVSLEARFTNCSVTGLLTESVAAANRRCITVAVDQSENNVLVITASSNSKQHPSDRFDVIDLARNGSPKHVGGLFRSTLLQDLL